MEDKVRDEFCSLEPDFPKEAYVVILVITSRHSGELKFLFPMPSLYTSLEDISLSIQTTIEEIKNSNVVDEPEIEVFENVILLPVYFYSRFPMKKEYWSKPSKHYDMSERAKKFTKVVSDPRLHLLLVTPLHFSDKEKQWHFSATLPLSLSYDDKEIEEFMFTSDQTVEVRAKNSAIYSFGSPLSLNWETLQIENVAKIADNPYSIN